MTDPAQTWRGAARIGAGWAVFEGAAGDNSLHSHHAIQAFAGPNAALFNARGERVQGAGIIVPADASHRAVADFSCAFLYIDPDAQAGRQIAVALGVGVRVLSAAKAQELSAIVAATLSGQTVDPVAEFADLIGAQHAPACPIGRIQDALAAFEQANRNLSSESLARHLELSRSRLSHLFAEEIGIPLRTFLLWSKLRRAFAGVTEGLSLTQAAHAGGFADSAHFSRTCVRMFGANPISITNATAFDEA